MKLNFRNLQKLGFKSNALFRRLDDAGLMHRRVGMRVEFTSGYTPNTVGYFQLTKQQMNRFEAGKLGLTPPGFCSPGSPDSRPLPATILHQGPVRSCAHLEKIFAASRPKHVLAGTSLSEEQYQLILRLREQGLKPLPVGSYEQTRRNQNTGEEASVGRLESVVLDWIQDYRRGTRQAFGLEDRKTWYAARDLYDDLWPENFYILVD